MPLRAWAGVVVVLLGGALAPACGSSSPAAPSLSTKAWKLSGTVRAASGGIGLSGARVTILDGPAASQVVVADGTGVYTFASVTQAGMNVQASAPGYTSQIIGVNLTADTVQDFMLTRALAANLQGVPGSVAPVSAPDNSWSYTIPAVNAGDGCAGSVVSIVTFTDANNRTVTQQTWTAPTGLVIRPGQQFSFTVTLSNDAALSTRSYFTTFQWVTVVCP